MFLFDLPDDVLCRILHFASAPSLSRFRATCKKSDILVTIEMEHRYKIVLSPFIHDHTSFRRELDSASAVISGSAALSLAVGSDFRPRDLDIYTPKENFFHVLAYLLLVERYTISSYVNTEYSAGIANVVRLTRGLASIDLVQSKTSCPALPVLNFWSTAVMIFASGSDLHMPYPALLEERRSLVNTSRTDVSASAFLELVRKIRLLDFDFRTSAMDWNSDSRSLRSHGRFHCVGDKSATCPFTIRWLDDKFSLTMPFSSLGDHGRTLSKAPPMATVVWWIGGSACGPECGGDGVVIPGRVWSQAVKHVRLECRS